MYSDYIFVGPEALSIIVKGVCTTVLPGDRIKKFYLTFFMKRYGEYLQKVDDSIEEIVLEPQVYPPPQNSTILPIEEELPIRLDEIPTPIVEEEKIETTEPVIQEKQYPYTFKGKTLNSALDVKTLLKEELQGLAIELGIPSDGKVKQLRESIDAVLIKRK